MDKAVTRISRRTLFGAAPLLAAPERAPARTTVRLPEAPPGRCWVCVDAQAWRGLRAAVADLGPPATP